MSLRGHEGERVIVGMDHPDPGTDEPCRRMGIDEHHLPRRDTPAGREKAVLGGLEAGEMGFQGGDSLFRGDPRAAQTHPVRLFPELAESLHRTNHGKAVHVEVDRSVGHLPQDDGIDGLGPCRCRCSGIGVGPGPGLRGKGLIGAGRPEDVHEPRTHIGGPEGTSLNPGP